MRSAGASGLLVAGFADRYDRKTLLLFFYTGFVLGTLWCGLANSFHALLAARVVTGARPNCFRIFEITIRMTPFRLKSFPSLRDIAPRDFGQETIASIRLSKFS